MEAQGFHDSKAKTHQYLKRLLGETHEKRIVDSFVDNAPKVARWLDENTSNTWTAIPVPDYYADYEGALSARILVPHSFDGKKLGDRLKDIRYTLQGLTLFDSMQIGWDELPTMSKPFSNFSNFRKATGKMLRYGLHKLRYGKGAYLANGNALVGSLIYTLDQTKTELWNNAAAVRLITEKPGEVSGVVVGRRHDGREIRIRANRGVVLASGGFGHSEEGRPFVPQDHCLSPSSVTGDGIRLAREIGGVLPPPNAENAVHSPISTYQPSKGPLRMYPHFAYDRAKPGSIIVGPDGRRFGNESEGYVQFISKMQALKIPYCFFICDKDFLWKYGMGMALPGPYPTGSLRRNGYLISARSIPDLANKLEISVENLERTVELNNQYAREGKDPEFQRGEGSFDRVFGDPSSKPNPSLGPCVKAPFYAVKMYPGNVSTMYGLKTNEHAQVLGPDEMPIKGLYAAGNDNNSVWRGAYPCGGSSLGPALTFGYVAAEKMAQ